jgi:hypothetical protein
VRIQEKWKVLIPDTTNGDTLGESMNLYKELSKNKTSESGKTGVA